jgi:hypothetical protein
MIGRNWLVHEPMGGSMIATGLRFAITLSIMSHEPRLSELCHAGPIFSCAVDRLIREARTAMCVPDAADADVEAEFCALRADFETFRSEFDDLFARLLLRQLGAAQLPQLLLTLGGEAEQRFLRVAGNIDVEFARFLQLLSQRLTFVAQRALAARQLAPHPDPIPVNACGGTPRAPEAAKATVEDDLVSLTLTRLTGADRAFGNTVELVIRHVLGGLGRSPDDPAVMRTPRALVLRASLNRLYPAFAALYTSLFAKHVGEEHLPAVLAALQGDPLRQYLHARTAMKPALAAGLREITGRMAQLVV